MEHLRSDSLKRIRLERRHAWCEACLPWLALIVALVLTLRFLLALSGARWRPAALKRHPLR